MAPCRTRAGMIPPLLVLLLLLPFTVSAKGSQNSDYHGAAPRQTIVASQQDRITTPASLNWVSAFINPAPLSRKRRVKEEKRLSASSSEAGSAAGNSQTQKALCRVCKTYFDREANHARACRYHPKSYTGDTKRKGDWSASKDRFELERMWWCCGEKDPDAAGCTYDYHKTYDD